MLHCYGGVSRTCAAACVLLMRFEGLRLDHILTLWQKHRTYYAPFLNREYMLYALIDVERDIFFREDGCRSLVSQELCDPFLEKSA